MSNGAQSLHLFITIKITGKLIVLLTNINKKEWGGAAKRKKRMGRRKIDMEKTNAKQVTFSIRRLGLFKKASEFVTLCNAEVCKCCLFSWKEALLRGKPNFDLIAERFKKESSQNRKGFLEFDFLILLMIMTANMLSPDQYQYKDNSLSPTNQYVNMMSTVRNVNMVLCH
ncbi:LOW QUALITY PROTEIN: hypothetical protein YC2023_006441 [Brassica napus]